VGGGDGVLAELGGMIIDGLGSRVSRADVTLIFVGESETSRMRPCIAQVVLLSFFSCRGTDCFFLEDDITLNSHFPFPGKMNLETTLIDRSTSNDSDFESLPSSRPGDNNLKGFIYTYSNLLLVFSPIGMLAHWQSMNSPTVVFWFNFLALMPLATILGDLTEDLSNALTSEALAGLLSATLGNTVELILMLQSLSHGLVSIAKASLLGSIFSNLLLVLGSSFFLGGIGVFEKEQIFNETAPLASLTMLLVACVTFAEYLKLDPIIKLKPSSKSKNPI